MWASYIGAFGLYAAYFVLSLHLAYVYQFSAWTLVVTIATPFLGGLFNQLLKSILRHPRPNNTRYLNKIERCLDGGVYGMPSGHAQLVGLTLCISLQMRLHPVLSLCLLTQTLVTLWQRYVYKKHTIEQLVWGLIVGYVTGFLYVFMISSYSIH